MYNKTILDCLLVEIGSIYYFPLAVRIRIEFPLIVFGTPWMLWAGKSNTFVTAYYNSRLLHLLFRHKLLDCGTAVWHKLANILNYNSYRWYISLPCDVISGSSSVWLAQFSRTTACCGSKSGEIGRRHFCLLGDLQGILDSLVVHVGCTAVASFKQSSGTISRGVTKISGCLPTLSTFFKLKIKNNICRILLLFLTPL